MTSLLYQNEILICKKGVFNTFVGCWHWNALKGVESINKPNINRWTTTEWFSSNGCFISIENNLLIKLTFSLDGVLDKGDVINWVHIIMFLL